MATKLNLTGMNRSREAPLHDHHASKLPGLHGKHSGAHTERSGASTSREEAKEAWELRRVIGENRKWRERCERLEWERDHARGEAERLADELADFTERWQEREEGVRELQDTIRELQRRLADTISDGAAADGPGLDAAKHMLSTWAGKAPPSPFSPAPPATAPPGMGSEGYGGRALMNERFGGRLKGTLENQRIVAKRSRKYTDLNAPALSLTPREASTTSYGTHMSERIAFQAGQVLKEQVKAQNRAEYLNTNMRMFGSVDLLVQVKIAEMNVQLEGASRPNIARLATVCDLFDKVTATSESNYVALSLLRDEIYCAIFEGFQADPGLSNTAPSVKRARILSSFAAFTAEDYASITPFFVQVSRLKASLSTAEEQLSDALTHSGNKTRRMHLATQAVEKLSNKFLSTILAHCFFAWMGVWTVIKWNSKLSFDQCNHHNRRKLIYRALLGWYRVVVKDKAETARRHIEREARKTEVYRKEAVRMARDTNALGRSDLKKDEIKQISNAWEGFAVTAANELLKETKRMVEEMSLPMLQDARLLLRSSESSVGPGIVDFMQAAPAEEWLVRWCEHKAGVKEGFLCDWGESVLDHDVIGTILRAAEADQKARDEAAGVDRSTGAAGLFRRGGVADHDPGRGGLMEQAHAASWALMTAEKLGMPAIPIDAASLSDENETIYKVFFLLHLFLHVPGLHFAKAGSLREEYVALQASFTKLESARALYVEGMDPVCRMVVSLHRKVQLEHRGIVRSFAVFNDGRRKVERLWGMLDRGGKGISEASSMRPDIVPVVEVNTNARLRLQKVMTLHSSKGHTASSEGLFPSGSQSLVAFSYLVENVNAASSSFIAAADSGVGEKGTSHNGGSGPRHAPDITGPSPRQGGRRMGMFSK